MLQNDYEYVLALYRDDGSGLGEFPVRPNWEPAAECTRFTLLRRGLPFPVSFGAAAAVQPQWDARLGRPHITGFEVVLDNFHPRKSCAFPLAYFSTLAQGLSTHFVEQGKLDPGELFRFSMAALRRSETREDDHGLRIAVRDTVPQFPLVRSSLDPFLEGSTPSGTESDGKMPVFLPHALLEETAELARQADTVETGGILIGRIHQDEREPEVFVEVTAQLPAQHTLPGVASLTFTRETWTAARQAIQLRRQHEEMVGWWHSHPAKAWCKDCPPEKRGDCVLQTCFFSLDDRDLHATVFPRAYSIALLVTDGTDGLRHDVFGWDEGMIALRGYRVLGAQDRDNRGVAEGAPA